MDFWSVDVGDRHHTFLTMLDWGSRWVECKQLKDKRAETVASAFLKHWVCRFGAPKELITDNDPSFMATVFDGICRRMGIRKIRTTVYHPEGNAPIETFHRTLRKGLSIFNLHRKKGITVNEAVQLVCLNYRSLIHLGLGDSPGYRLMGIDLRPPSSDTDWRFLTPCPDQDRLRFLSLHRLELYNRARVAYEVCRENSESAGQQSFEIGNIVLTRLRPIELARYAERDGTRKLLPKYSAPFRVIRVIRSGQMAIVRPLAAAGPTKEVHIRDCRIMPSPDDKCLKSWEAASLDDLSIFDPAVRRIVLKDSYEEADRPQKRQRI
jgi:hypothetical protein